MKITVKKAVIIEDGDHEGVIINVIYRQKVYAYTDLVIQFSQGEEKVDLKAGYPTMITKNSQLGQLLERFGEKLEEGSEVDPDKVLIGKIVKFKTYTQTNEKGRFARVIPDSVKPVQGMQRPLI